MKKSGRPILLAVLAVVVASTFVSAHGRKSHSASQPGLVPVELLDIDGDNRISKDEFVLHQTERFMAIDANTDGYMTVQEVRAYRSQFQPVAKAAPAHVVKKQNPQNQYQDSERYKLVKQADRDGDERLSRAEFAYLGDQMFLQLDVNKDGFISNQDR